MKKPDLINSKVAAALLQEALGDINATWWLADNRRGRTAFPTIPYVRHARQVFYKRHDILEAARQIGTLPHIAAAETAKVPRSGLVGAVANVWRKLIN